MPIVIDAENRANDCACPKAKDCACPSPTLASAEKTTTPQVGEHVIAAAILNSEIKVTLPE